MAVMEEVTAAPMEESFGAGHGGRGGSGRRAGFGYRRFGYGGLGFYGFGLLGYGLYFDALPFYYSTYWWGGSPYYYAGDNFYQWNASVGQYETVRPPQDLASEGVRADSTGTRESVSLFENP